MVPSTPSTGRVCFQHNAWECNPGTTLHGANWSSVTHAESLVCVGDNNGPKGKKEKQKVQTLLTLSSFSHWQCRLKTSYLSLTSEESWEDTSIIQICTEKSETTVSFLKSVFLNWSNEKWWVHFETWCFQFASKQMSLPVDKIKRNTSTQMVFSLQTKRFPVTWPCDVTSDRSFRRWSPPLLFPRIKCEPQEWQGSPRQWNNGAAPLYC